MSAAFSDFKVLAKSDTSTPHVLSLGRLLLAKQKGPNRSGPFRFLLPNAKRSLGCHMDRGAEMIVKDDVTNPTEYDLDTFAIKRGMGSGCIKPTRLTRPWKK
jgi:hypothetical protein